MREASVIFAKKAVELAVKGNVEGEDRLKSQIRYNVDGGQQAAGEWTDEGQGSFAGISSPGQHCDFSKIYNYSVFVLPSLLIGLFTEKIV